MNIFDILLLASAFGVVFFLAPLPLRFAIRALARQKLRAKYVSEFYDLSSQILKHPATTEKMAGLTIFMGETLSNPKFIRYFAVRGVTFSLPAQTSTDGNELLADLAVTPDDLRQKFDRAMVASFLGATYGAGFSGKFVRNLIVRQYSVSSSDLQKNKRSLNEDFEHSISVLASLSGGVTRLQH